MKKVFETFEQQKEYLTRVCDRDCYATALNLYTTLYLNMRIHGNSGEAQLFCSQYLEAKGTFTLTGGRPQVIKCDTNGEPYVTYLGRRYYLNEFCYVR